VPGHRAPLTQPVSVRVATHAQIVAGGSRTTSVHQSVQIDLFFDLTGELEVDDNNQVTGASIGLADAGSDLPPMPCLRRYAGNEKCGR
jgi:hypothetical protein